VAWTSDTPPWWPPESVTFVIRYFVLRLDSFTVATFFGINVYQYFSTYGNLRLVTEQMRGYDGLLWSPQWDDMVHQTARQLTARSTSLEHGIAVVDQVLRTNFSPRPVAGSCDCNGHHPFILLFWTSTMLTATVSFTVAMVADIETNTEETRNNTSSLLPRQAK